MSVNEDRILSCLDSIVIMEGGSRRRVDGSLLWFLMWEFSKHVLFVSRRHYEESTRSVVIMKYYS